MPGPILKRARAVAAGFTALLVVPTASLLAQSTREDSTPAPEVRKLALRGVDHVDAHDLEKSIATQASSCRNLLLEIFCVFSRSPVFVEHHYLDRRELPRDVTRIRAYYWRRGFRDTEVDTVVTPVSPGAVSVAFEVHENAPTRVRRLAITYDSTLIGNRQRDRLTLLRANDPLDLVLLDSMRTLFADEMWDRGYGDAVVDTTVTVDTAAKLADVQLRLIKKRLTTVGPIVLTGNDQIKASTIFNSITLRTGELFRRGDVLESQRSLYESNLFRQATINVPVQRDTVKAVEISVIEAPLQEARTGAGLNNVDFFQVEARYTNYYLFGGGRRLDLNGSMGNLVAAGLQGVGPFRDIAADVPDSNVAPFLEPTWATSADFKQPAFLNRRADAVGLGIFGHRQANPGVFIDRGYGGTATLTHLLLPRAPLSLNYRYEVNRVFASDVFFCVDYGVCDTETIASLRTHQSLSPISLTGFIDRSDKPFSPTKGYVARVDIEHASASTGSNYHYNRALMDAALYSHKSRTNNVFSAHLRLGFVRALAGGPGDVNVLHPRKRFYAGGANSVRGYNENQLGPRVLTIDDSVLLAKGARTVTGAPCDTTSAARIVLCDPNTGDLSNRDFIPQPLGGTSLLEGSVEYRVPLPFYRGKFVGAVFLDGAVVGQSSVQSLFDLQKVTKGAGAITPGFGIRYESGVGPIRIDFGIHPSGSEPLTVVTNVTVNGQSTLIPLNTPRTFSSTGRTLFDRLILHFSIGQAY